MMTLAYIFIGLGIAAIALALAVKFLRWLMRS